MDFQDFGDFELWEMELAGPADDFDELDYAPPADDRADSEEVPF